jgi:4-hydroxybutyrate dehydrogenase
VISTFSFPTKIVFGPGAIEQVADAARSFSMKHPLLVTDRGIVKSGLVERLAAPLNKAGLTWALFDKVEGNPTEASVFRHFSR